LALRLAGLPNRRLLVTRSPGKAFTSQPGEYAATWHSCGFFPARAALSRATGLPGCGLPGTRSPGKAFTPQPGECVVTWHCCGFFPAKRSIASGAVTSPHI
ncbi:hypothetical protein PO393_14135, partial [Klebsiella michiganensis]|uniref:hypothetical protein n=3 Tax=Klebsiella TaxID=570 RepID=UPI002FF4D48A